MSFSVGRSQVALAGISLILLSSDESSAMKKSLHASVVEGASDSVQATMLLRHGFSTQRGRKLVCSRSISTSNIMKHLQTQMTQSPHNHTAALITLWYASTPTTKRQSYDTSTSLEEYHFCDLSQSLSAPLHTSVALFSYTWT